ARCDQGNIHGELAVAADKLLGTIERVHQPVTLPTAALRPGDVGIFFRKYGDARVERPQALDDDFVRCQVGGGKGTLVVLAAYFVVGLRVDTHDGPAGLARDAPDRIEQ